MASPTQAQLDKLTINLTRWDDIVNEGAGDTVSLDSHTVKTVSGYLTELTATNPRGAWATTTAYAQKDIVVESSVVYICVVAHTSGTFATDLSAGKWAVQQLDVTSAITLHDDLIVDTNVLKVDSTNNRVGVGIATPDKPFHVEQNSTSVLATIKAKNNGTGDITVQLSVTATDFVLGLDNSDSDKFKMGFATELTSITEFVMDSTGKIGMGEATPVADVHIGGTANSEIVRLATTGGLNLFGGGYVALCSNAYSYGNASDFKNIQASSSVGMGIVSPMRTATSTTQGGIFVAAGNSSADTVYNWSSLTPAITWDTAGKVGLGKESPGYLVDLAVTRQTEDQGIALTPTAGTSKVLWVNTGDFTGNVATDLVTASRGHGLFFLGQRSSATDYRNEVWAVNIEDDGTTVNATQIGSSNGAGSISSVSFSVASGVLQVVTGSSETNTSCHGFFQYD